MPCICEKCGCVCSCGEYFCDQCFLDALPDDTERNLFAGGHFYDKETKSQMSIKEDLSASADS